MPYDEYGVFISWSSDWNTIGVWCFTSEIATTFMRVPS